MIYTYFEAPVSLRQVIALPLYTSEKTHAYKGFVYYEWCARDSALVNNIGTWPINTHVRLSQTCVYEQAYYLFNIHT